MKGVTYERKDNHMSEAQAKDFLRIMHNLARISHAQTNLGVIPKAEFFILSSLDETCPHAQQQGKCGITVSNLAKKTDTNLPAVSKLLRVVEDKGYVARFPDDTDRRVVYYGLTEKGRTVITESRMLVLKNIQSMLDLLGERDSAEVINIFNRLLSIVSSASSPYANNLGEENNQFDPSAEKDP